MTIGEAFAQVVILDLITLCHPALDAGSISSRHPRPDRGSISSRHPALDAGSSPD